MELLHTQDTTTAAGIRDIQLRVAGQPYPTTRHEFAARVDEWLRDPVGTANAVQAANAAGAIPAGEEARFFARLAIADAHDIAVAIDAAHDAARRFAGTSLAERKRMVMAMGQALLLHREEIIALGACEGRPRNTFEWETNHHFEEKGTFTDETLDFYCRQLEGEAINAFDRVAYCPYGVVGFVPPGNAAIYNSLAGMIGAVMAGNALVIKPPRNRAAQTLRLVEVWDEVAAEFGHPGLFNTVVGDSRAIIEAWGDSPKIDVVVYYGGSGLGMEVGALLTRKATKPVLELAGSDAVVLWEDADVAAATSAIFLTRYFVNAGQICIAPKRLFIHRAIYDAVVARLTEMLNVDWVVDLPGRLDTESPFLMPLFDMDRKLCVATLADARKRGKPILAGGRWLDHTGAENPAGAYLLPTLIGDATPDMHSMRHEIFGPVLPAMAIDSLDEAIELANDSLYGLRASIWTNDSAIAERFALGVKVGSVFVNDHTLHFNGKAPYIGGVKASGFSGAKYFHLELSVRRYIHHGRSLPFYHHNRGMDHLRAGRVDEALREFEKALALDRDFAHGHLGRGLALLVGQEAAQAEAAFREALARRDDLFEAHANLGWVLMHTGRREAAAGVFARAAACADGAEQRDQAERLAATCREGGA